MVKAFFHPENFIIGFPENTPIFQVKYVESNSSFIQLKTTVPGEGDEILARGLG
jgi:hypothetical protein